MYFQWLLCKKWNCMLYKNQYREVGTKQTFISTGRYKAWISMFNFAEPTFIRNVWWTVVLNCTVNCHITWWNWKKRKYAEFQEGAEILSVTTYIVLCRWNVVLSLLCLLLYVFLYYVVCLLKLSWHFGFT